MDKRHITIAGLAIVALAIGAWLFIEREPDQQSLVTASVAALPKTKGHAPVIASEIALLRTLGSSVDADIPLLSPGEAIELRVLPEFAARPARYRIRLFRMSADDSLQSVAELGGLTPAPDNFVTIFIDGARLRPGQYRLAIVGDPDTDARDKESAFILKMRREPNDPSAPSR